MNRSPTLMCIVVIAGLLMPLVAVAMIPSTCGVFRHWAFLELLDEVTGEQAKAIPVFRFDLDIDRDGQADLFLSSPAAKTREQGFRVMHIYSPTPGGNTYVYIGQLALAGFRQDAETSRLIGVEVDAESGASAVKAYLVSHQGLMHDTTVAVSSDSTVLETAKAAIARWLETSQQQWWQTDLAALQASVWESAPLLWKGETTGETRELANKLFNTKVERDRSPGKSKAKTECKTMKR